MPGDSLITDVEGNARYESKTSNDFDPDRLAGDVTDDNTIDDAIIASSIARDTELHAAITLAGTPAYITLSGQEITRLPIRSVWADTVGNDGLVSQVQLAAWTGSANLTTVGTIGTGTWNATAIDESKIDPDIARDSELHAAVTLAGTPAYITLSGQEITRLPIRSVWADTVGNDGLVSQVQLAAWTGSTNLTTVGTGAVDTGELANYAVTEAQLGFVERPFLIMFPDTLTSAAYDTLWFPTSWSSTITITKIKALSFVSGAAFRVVKKAENGNGAVLVDVITTSTGIGA